MISLLQAYRGIAALLVVLFHAKMIVDDYFDGHDLLYMFDMGEAGVQFFFVLSGFIIFYIHHKDLGVTSNVSSYLLKRIIRIYPIYIIITLLFTPFWFLIPDFGNDHHKEIIPLIKSLLLFPQTNNPHLGVAWTLTHEIFFYLMFSVAIINKQFGKFLLISWFTLIVVFNFTGVKLLFPFNFLLSINNLLFGMGIIAAMLVMRYQYISFGRFVFILSNAAFFAIALAAATLHEKLGRTVDILFIVLMGLAATAIILQAKAPFLESFFGQKKGLLLLGNASYSIYLIHFPVLSATGKLLDIMAGNTLHPLIIFPIITIIATASGIFVHLLIEQPITNYLSQRVRAKKKDSSS